MRDLETREIADAELDAVAGGTRVTGGGAASVDSSFGSADVKFGFDVHTQDPQVPAVPHVPSY